MSVHIYRPTAWRARTTQHCTTCRQRRRFVVRLYEWHPSRWTCGGCGYTFTSGEGRAWAGKAERQRERERVKAEWPTIKRLGEVVRNLCAVIHDGGAT